MGFSEGSECLVVLPVIRVELPESVRGGVMGLEGDSEHLETLLERWEAGMNGSVMVEELKCGVGIVDPAMLELRAAGCGKLRRAPSGP